MAFIIKDRVKENTTSTGTGAVSLGGAAATFDTFQSYMSNGDTTYYAIVHTSSGVDEWEVGIGTWNTGNTLTRTTVLAGSNGTSAENFSAGTKDIFMTYPASKAVFMDSAGDVAFSGDIDVAGSAEIETHIDLKTTTSNKPSHSEGRIFYDAAFGALAVYNDESDITLQVGQEEYIRVKNNTGATIANGTPVYLTGEDVATPTVAVARADGTFAQSMAVGIATHDIETNTIGYITTRGLIADVDTSHLTVGEQVHVAVGASGGTQTAAPSYPYFATDVGICLISSASGGCIYVNVEHHSMETLRVTENAHFDSNVTIDGDLTVLGTQTIASSTNIALSGALQYLNSGDTIGASNTTFTGTGLDDATLVGHYEGTTSSKTFKVKITTAGTPDKFRWSTDNFTTQSAEINIDGTEQTLEDGISVEFNATTGHTVGDIWSGSASPVNVDTGMVTNRNTGGSGVGYTHAGLYYDVSTNKWTFFDEYGPEPNGAIDTTDSTFELATVKAETFEGDLDGDVTGDVTGNVSGNVTGSLTGNVTGDVTGDVTGNADTATALETARTISLTGDVTGSVSFDGSDNAAITAVVQDNSHSHTIANVTNLQSTLNGKAATSTTITAGNGLTGGGNLTANRTLAVGAGTGVTVGADSISIGQAVGTTDNVTFNNITANGTTNLNSIVNIDVAGTNLVLKSDDVLRETIEWKQGVNTRWKVKLQADADLDFVANDTADLFRVQNKAVATTAGSGLSKSDSSYTISHADTSTQASVNNSNGTVIQDITLDTYGHITGINSVNLDGRYYTETEADSRFVNVTGDTMTGNLKVSIPDNGGSPAMTAELDLWGYEGRGAGISIRDSANSASGATNREWFIGSGYNQSGFNIGYSSTATQTSYSAQNKFSLSTSGNAVFAGTAHVNTNQKVFADNYHPNADKWTTARTLSLSGDASGSVSWDGSANATLSVTVANDSHTHDGRYYTETEADSRFVNVTGDTMTGTLVLDHNTNPMLKLQATNGSPWALELGRDDATNSKVYNGGGFWSFEHEPRYYNGGSPQKLFHDGYHPNADKWTTARTLSLSGDASGSVSWDGSSNATLSVTVANDSHTHDTRYIKKAGDTLTGTLNYRMLQSQSTSNYDTAGDSSGFSVFYGTSSATSKPSGTDHAVATFSYNSSWQTQMAMDWRTKNMYFRTQENGTWKSWSKMWHDGNDGSGSGLDADLLDGVQGSAYMRSDTSDTISGDLTITGQNALICDGIDSGNPAAGADDLRVSGYGILGNRGTLYFTNGGGGIQFGVGSTHNASSACTIDTSKNFTASGNVTAYSDERLKDNIVTIDNALDKIAAIRGVTYNRNDIDGAPRQSGVIAQEVEKVLPEVVLTDDEGIKTVAYGNMVGLLIEAIKEQQRQIDELKAELGV